MKMRALIIWLTLFLVGGVVVSALARAPATTSGGSGMALLNLEDSIALHGYDPVAYFTDGEAVKGSKRTIERLGGAEYHFASRGNRYEFLGNAPRYQPQFGGYCATSMARGRLEDINPRLFVIYDNKLYLFNNTEARSMFQREPRRIIAQAREQYFKLASEQRGTY
jgi:YHS domain-containing protein